jgi:hypothetical protein
MHVVKVADWDPGDPDEGAGRGRAEGRAQQAQGELNTTLYIKGYFHEMFLPIFSHIFQAYG